MEPNETIEPDEIINILREKGVNISRATLTNYENHNLISLPERGGFGRGGGRYTYYPKDVLPSIYAIAQMAHTRRFTFWTLGKIVCNATAFEKQPDKLRDGLEKLDFSFMDHSASMSLVFREHIAPVLRFVCLKHYFSYGVSEQGLEITYKTSLPKEIKSTPTLYNNKTTYTDVIINSFTFRLVILPVPTLQSVILKNNEGLWISNGETS